MDAHECNGKPNWVTASRQTRTSRAPIRRACACQRRQTRAGRSTSQPADRRARQSFSVVGQGWRRQPYDVDLRRDLGPRGRRHRCHSQLCGRLRPVQPGEKVALARTVGLSPRELLALGLRPFGDQSVNDSRVAREPAADRDEHLCVARGPRREHPRPSYPELRRDRSRRSMSSRNPELRF